MIQKIENWLFYLFLFSIPISLRHIFGFEPFGYIEWTAKYVYATDILLIILFIFWIIRSNFEFKILNLKKADWVLLAFIFVAAVSVKNSLDVNTAWFQWLKLAEGVILYFYIKNYVLKRFDVVPALMALVLGGVFQSIIAIMQFSSQSSLGLKYLGESVLMPSMTGVAAFIVDGIKVLRPYGTTPHSNVLASYLLVSLAAFYALSGLKIVRSWWWYALHLITLWAFLLTFSRVIVGVGLLVLVVHVLAISFLPRFREYFMQNHDGAKRSLKLLAGTVAVVILFTVVNWNYVLNRVSISASDEAIQMRLFYNQEALDTKENLFGLGIGNFVPWLTDKNPYFSKELYQPVHNIYLLIRAETGNVGLILFLAFLILLWRDYYKRTKFKKLYHFSFALVVASVLLLGLFDHFLWTVQSGRLVFWMSLGLLAGTFSNDKTKLATTE